MLLPLMMLVFPACDDDQDVDWSVEYGQRNFDGASQGGSPGTGGNPGGGGRDGSGTGGSAGTAGTGGAGGSAGTAGTGGVGGRGGIAGTGGVGGSAGTAGTGGGSPDVMPDVPATPDAATPDMAAAPDVAATPDMAPARRGPAPVELGSTTNLAAPGAYVLLAKTGITNVTGSSITDGHVGLSPAAATFITGFSLVADPSNVFATSVSVVSPSKVYAANYAVPTPSNLTTAVLAMQAAYTDAAGRTLPDFLNLGDGNIGGKTLAPGLYTWGTGVTIPDDVTISGGANDTWIFQVAQDVDVSAAKKVILAGGALARNVVWQVAGQVTIHANAHFEGIILSKTGITLQTMASMKGRALAQTLIALDNNAITAP